MRCIAPSIMGRAYSPAQKYLRSGKRERETKQLFQLQLISCQIGIPRPCLFPITINRILEGISITAATSFSCNFRLPFQLPTFFLSPFSYIICYASFRPYPFWNRKTNFVFARVIFLFCIFLLFSY